MKKERINFRTLLSYFPTIDLPVQLTDETHHVFSRENKILPGDFLHTFFIRDEDEVDEFTEYLPCFRIDQFEECAALVIWRAQLMDYAYLVFTFDKKGSPIAQQVIAGTRSNGKTILTRQAKIDEDGIISVVEGVGAPDGSSYDPAQSRSFSFEIMETGDILQQADSL
ncbi:MAG: hypothetical protein KTR24_11165 [Saprospiraceae bacterium]|nr:hypothetical protein [Saprospiraceae bacterium]